MGFHFHKLLSFQNLSSFVELKKGPKLRYFIVMHKDKIV